MQTDKRKDDGLTLVRRFTDELKGDTTLERATIDAQQQQDDIEDDRRRKRMQALYEDPDRDPSDFRSHEVEAARLALQAACKQLEKDDRKPSMLQKMSSKRHKHIAAANEALLSSGVYDFNSLQTLVEDFETQWRDGQQHVGNRFRSICNRFDEHKAAFAIFPSQSVYTSVLCGSLAMIVGAAVNYSEIAERLSDMVADIADKAARAAYTVLIFPTHDFRDLFSRLYAQVFLFYRDAILWYTKSKFGRALESFNESLAKPYEKAAAKIESLLIEIYRQGQLASWAREFLFKENVEDEIRRQRQQIQNRDNLISAGRQGQRLLLLNYDHASVEVPSQVSDKSQDMLDASDQAFNPGAPERFSRERARNMSIHLKPFVTGVEGPSLFNDGRFWLPDAGIASNVSSWMNPDVPLPILWIKSPAASREFPSSRAAAMIAAATAWRSEIPIISHFCERPRYSNVPEGQTIEQAGMLGLIYSLIIQLLQFNVEEDTFVFAQNKFENLNGSKDSWPDALLLLRELLRSTPLLQGCIIDGLNDLCFSDGAGHCDGFLSMLLEHQKSIASGFRILLTTTGQSRVLPGHVQVEHRVIAQRAAKEVVRDDR